MEYHTWVNCTTNVPAQGVPATLIKPIEEIKETLTDYVLCASEIEPSIYTRNNQKNIPRVLYTFISHNRKQTDQEGCKEN